MLRMVTAYECPECGDVWTKAEATEAGPLVECECGQQYELGTLGSCLSCDKTGKGAKVISKLGCEKGCCAGVTPVRMLLVKEGQAFDGTWREPEEGGLLVRVTQGDLRRIAKEAGRDDRELR